MFNQDRDESAQLQTLSCFRQSHGFFNTQCSYLATDVSVVVGAIDSKLAQTSVR